MAVILPFPRAHVGVAEGVACQAASRDRAVDDDVRPLRDSGIAAGESPRGAHGKTLFAETLTLLRSVRDHDFDTLAGLCDDDFGIVDIAPDGGNVPIRTRAEWEGWFRNLFSQLQAMQAVTDSQVLAYDALETGDLGYGVLEFRQSLSVGGHTATFDCVATLIWKRTPEGWRESRWHCSVLSKDVPPELAALPYDR